jgi:hypothetical protein
MMHGPRAAEGVSFQQQEIDLVALPSERTAIIRAIGQQPMH